MGGQIQSIKVLKKFATMLFVFDVVYYSVKLIAKLSIISLITNTGVKAKLIHNKSEVGTMKEVLVRDIYTVDTISKGNSKAWLNLMKWMEDNLAEGEKVQFDFKGIEVIQPWATNEFRQFMQDERVHVKIWNNEQTVNSINIMCRLNGFSSNRAVNVVVEVAKTMTKEEIAIIKMADELQQFFEINEDDPSMAVLHIHRRFDQIGVPITVAYIEAAMKKFARENNITKIRLDAIGITIQSSVIKNVTSLISSMAEEKVMLEINSSDEEVMNKVAMYQSLEGSKIVSEKDKVRIIKASLHPGKVGMLVKYKVSKAVDEFGRSGKGKTISCRVALYNGLKKDKEGIKLNFTTFNGKYFYTKVHWGLENDNELLEKLETEELSIPVEQFGMYNDFLGSRYHLITPVQNREEDTITMYGIDDQGKVTYTKMTIPERIKAVFDDWGIKYDMESMQSYIQKTREVLSKA